jgi:hypothetical protein
MTESRISGSTYPQMSPESSAAVARKLVEIVSLHHNEALSADQLDEVRRTVAAQLAATQRLHRFPLTNDREPIFVVRANSEVSA